MNNWNVEDFFNQWFQGGSLLSVELFSRVLASVLTIILIIIVRAAITRGVIRRIEDVRIRYLWQKTVTYLLLFLGLIFIINIWFQGIQEMTMFLGLLSAGIAIALKDIIANFAGWVFIMWVRPFAVSNRIQIGTYSGDVIDISLFHTTLMEIGNWVDADQSTGRIVKIPNELVFTQSLANYSQGFQFIWNEIPVLITFESNWHKAKDILAAIASRHAEHLSESAARKVREASHHFMIFYSKLTPTVYTSVRDCGVLLTIRYLCEPRHRRGTEEEIWEDILTAFAGCDDIDFAYPTQRFYDNLQEGKSGLRGDGGS
ncbi:mechanosensitive ion channel family protein [Candidatus Latescibacterota bacterium]